MPPLRGREIGLDGVVLVEFGLDVVIEGLQFLLQGVDEVGDGFVGAVFDFVPLEGAEVLVDGFYIARLRYPSPTWLNEVGVHTIIYQLLLLDFALIVVQYRS